MMAGSFFLNFLDEVVDAKIGKGQAGILPVLLYKMERLGDYGRLNARTRKTAIWSRLTVVVGQYIEAAHPPVMPSAASCLIQAAAQ